MAIPDGNWGKAQEQVWEQTRHVIQTHDGLCVLLLWRHDGTCAWAEEHKQTSLGPQRGLSKSFGKCSPSRDSGSKVMGFTSQVVRVVILGKLTKLSLHVSPSVKCRQ